MSIVLDLREARPVCRDVLPPWSKNFGQRELAKLVARLWPSAMWLDDRATHRGWLIPLAPLDADSVRCALAKPPFGTWKVGVLCFDGAGAARFTIEWKAKGFHHFDTEFPPSKFRDASPDFASRWPPL